MSEIIRSESIAALADALAKAQREIKGAKKESKNAFFKSQYADLASVWEACREPLTANGLSVVQLPVGGQGDVEGASISVVTLLLHKSGEYIGSEIVMHPKNDDPQSAGSALAYARRYSLAAIIGIAQIDDDAETAMNRGDEAPVSEERKSEKAQHVAKKSGQKDSISVDGKLEDVMGKKDKVWGRIGEHIFYAATEPNISRIQSMKEQMVNVLLLDSGHTRNGKVVYTLHMISLASEYINDADTENGQATWSGGGQ